jgi:hypothetical protein
MYCCSMKLFDELQSKTDDVQIEYYVAVGLSTNTKAEITPTQFYAGVSEIFEVNLH